MAFSKIVVDGEKLTRENFKNPPKEMGILPFWFWNGEMNEEEMEWQMKEYKAKGIPGFFIHGRFGDKLGYLSEKWFDRVKFAVEKAKEIGIDVWVYDEMNWPSGTANRTVPKENPKLRQRYLELVALNVDGPLFTFLEATDSRYVNTGDSKPIAAYACTEKEFKNSIEELIDLTPNLSFNKVIPWEAPKGKWRLLYFLEKEVDYYIDALNPDSTKKFLEYTHDKYKESVGNEFGKIVPGFYTDEPAMHYFEVGRQNHVIPWSSQMFKIFRERRGYDLKPLLPALFLDMGEKTAQVRYDFWRTLTEQYRDSYFKQIRNWCEDNGVLFTGHLLFEEVLRLMARCEGNVFKYLEQFHITGVDHLYPKIGSKKDPDQHVALKIGSSAAHHFGSNRLLCESMGGTYWDCTLERMKWIANWEYVLGVNIFNNHGYHYSIEGERKRDWPPSQFYHHTWWKYYNHFTEYMARLGHILSGGKHVAKLLMLFPMNSIWTNYKPQKRDVVSKIIENHFNFVTDTLLRFHYDFDYADEDIFNGAKIKDGKIKIRDEKFEVLVLPPITHITKTTFDSIKKFVEGGGKVLADTFLPVSFLDSEKDGAVNQVKELFGVDPDDLLNIYNGGKNKKVKTQKKENVFVIHGKGISKTERRKKIKDALEKLVVPDVSIDNEDVFYLHRIKDGYDIYFFVNIQQNKAGKVNISLEKVGQPELWNPVNGELQKIYNYRVNNNRLEFTLNFDSTESHIVILKNKLSDSYITDTNLVIEEFKNDLVRGYQLNNDDEIKVKVQKSGSAKTLKQKAKSSLSQLKLGNKYHFEIENDNVLLIDKWKMHFEYEESGENYFDPDFNDSEWLDVTKGAWEMQLPQEREELIYPAILWYRTSFNVEDMPDYLNLMIDGFSGSSYKLFVNGKEVKDKGKRSYLDAEIKEVDISKYVVDGENKVAVKIIGERRTDGLLDLLKITGKFSLSEKDNSLSIQKLKPEIAKGDWTKKGLPFYSGTAVYSTKFNLKDEHLNTKMILETDCGEDVCEVEINGKTKVIPWNPYSIDIGDMVKEGENEIRIKVTNTLINILEGVRKKSGLLKEPRINFYNYYDLKY